MRYYPAQLRNLWGFHHDPREPKRRPKWPLWLLVIVWLLQILQIVVLASSLYTIYQASKHTEHGGQTHPHVAGRLILLAVYVGCSALLVFLEISLDIFGCPSVKFYLELQVTKLSGALFWSTLYTIIQARSSADHVDRAAAYVHMVLTHPKFSKRKNIYLAPQVVADQAGEVYPSPYLVYFFDFFLYASMLYFVPAALKARRDAKHAEPHYHPPPFTKIQPRRWHASSLMTFIDPANPHVNVDKYPLRHLNARQLAGRSRASSLTFIDPITPRADVDRHPLRHPNACQPARSRPSALTFVEPVNLYAGVDRMPLRRRRVSL